MVGGSCTHVRLGTMIDVRKIKSISSDAIWLNMNWSEFVMFIWDQSVHIIYFWF